MGTKRQPQEDDPRGQERPAARRHRRRQQRHRDRRRQRTSRSRTCGSGTSPPTASSCTTPTPTTTRSPARTTWSTTSTSRSTAATGCSRSAAPAARSRTPSAGATATPPYYVGATPFQDNPKTMMITNVDVLQERARLLGHELEVRRDQGLRLLQQRRRHRPEHARLGAVRADRGQRDQGQQHLLEQLQLLPAELAASRPSPTASASSRRRGTLQYPTGIGVALFGADGWTVKNNNIFGNFKWGVAMFSDPFNEGDDATSQNNQIINNEMGRNGTDINGRATSGSTARAARQLLHRQRQLDVRSRPSDPGGDHATAASSTRPARSRPAPSRTPAPPAPASATATWSASCSALRRPPTRPRTSSAPGPSTRIRRSRTSRPLNVTPGPTARDATRSTHRNSTASPLVGHGGACDARRRRRRAREDRRRSRCSTTTSRRTS